MDVSSGKLSQITDKIVPELEAWHARPLEALYPIVYLDAMHRSGGPVQSQRKWTGGKQSDVQRIGYSGVYDKFPYGDKFGNLLSKTMDFKERASALLAHHIEQWESGFSFKYVKMKSNF